MKETITSLQNCLIKEVVRLKKESYRKKTGIVVIEGEKEVKIAINTNISIIKVIICEKYKFDRSAIPDVPVENILKISEKLFKKLSKRENPDGIMVLANIKEKQISDIGIKNDLLLIAVEKIEKPGNLGAIIRSADAAGADAVFVIDSYLDIYNPNIIRNSRGSVFSLPVVPIKLVEFIKWVKENDVNIFAASPHESRNYCEHDYKNKCAFLLGNEHNGLSKEALKIANNKIKIPMNGEIDSLNISVSAAILLYEALRQRPSKKT